MTGKRRGNGPGNVCIVAQSFYSSEANVRREAEALLEDGFAVHVVCLRAENEARHEAVGGIDVHRLPLSNRQGRGGRLLLEHAAFFVLASIRLLLLDLKHRFRVIQVNTTPDCRIFATLIPRLAGARIILHTREPMPELYEALFDRRYWRGLAGAIGQLEKLGFLYADHVLTATREMRDAFGSRGADVNKITVIVDVPDDRLYCPDRYDFLAEKLAGVKKEERRKGKFRVFCHGTIEERYGMDIVVKAVALLKDEIPGIEFRFAGAGGYLPRVQALARELKVDDRVIYVGSVPFETLIEEILAADVAVVPVRKTPYTVLKHTAGMFEYIALQKSVVVSRLDAVAAYFPEDSLVFFEPGSGEDLATGLKYVFAHPEEMESTGARVERATEIYETHCWDREKRKYAGVYHSLLDL